MQGFERGFLVYFCKQTITFFATITTISTTRHTRQGFLINKMFAHSLDSFLGSVGGGVRAGGAADGALVDAHHLVQMLQALQMVEPAGPEPRPVELDGQGLIENLVDQGGLAGAGHAGDAGEGAQGDLHVDILQIVLGRAAWRQGACVFG